MTYEELCTAVAKTAGVGGIEARAILDALRLEIGERLAAGEEIRLPSLGTLAVKEQPARQIRHVGTGALAMLEPRRTARLKPSSKLIARLNRTGGAPA